MTRVVRNDKNPNFVILLISHPYLLAVYLVQNHLARVFPLVFRKLYDYRFIVAADLSD